MSDEDAQLEKILQVAEQRVRGKLEREYQKKINTLSENVLRVNKDFSDNFKNFVETQKKQVEAIGELIKIMKDFEEKLKAIKELLMEVFGNGTKGKGKGYVE